MIINRLAGYAAAAAGTVLVLAGCAGGPPGRGPLAGEELSELTQCNPASPDGLYTDGDNSIPNRGTKTAVIDSVSLVSPHAMKLLAAWVVPVMNGPIYGAWPGRPPNGYHHPPSPGFEWAARQKAVGAQIPPTPGGGPGEGGDLNVNLLLLLAVPPHGAASNDGYEIAYHVGRAHYRFRTLEKLVLRTTVAGSCPGE
jgi:hypothetical protein